jgi:hypothetical protein
MWVWWYQVSSTLVIVELAIDRVKTTCRRFVDACVRGCGCWAGRCFTQLIPDQCRSSRSARRHSLPLWIVDGVDGTRDEGCTMEMVVYEIPPPDSMSHLPSPSDATLPSMSQRTGRRDVVAAARDTDTYIDHFTTSLFYASLLLVLLLVHRRHPIPNSFSSNSTFHLSCCIISAKAQINNMSIQTHDLPSRSTLFGLSFSR